MFANRRDLSANPKTKPEPIHKSHQVPAPPDHQKCPLSSLKDLLHWLLGTFHLLIVWPGIIGRAFPSVGLAFILGAAQLPAESLDWWEAYQTALRSESCLVQIDHFKQAIRQRGDPGFLTSSGTDPFESYFPFVSLAEAYEDCNELDLAHEMVLIAISRGQHLAPRLNPPANLQDRERRRWEYQVSRSRERRIGELRVRLQTKRDLVAEGLLVGKGLDDRKDEKPPRAHPSQDEHRPPNPTQPPDPIQPKEPIPTTPVPQLPIKRPTPSTEGLNARPIEFQFPDPQEEPVPRPEPSTGPTAALQIGRQLRITCSAPCKFLPEEGAVEVDSATWLLPRGYPRLWIDGKKQNFPRRRDLSYDRDLRAMEALMEANLENRIRLNFGHEDSSSQNHKLALKAIPTPWVTGALMFPTRDPAELYELVRLSRIHEIAALKTFDLTPLKTRLLTQLADLRPPY
ncbi:MAG: hypothetical protein K0U98_05580 [Deltaproteobacteria bacterium]|nr:hypothetical protein [Deltaproteobacteria bacterium]